MTSLVFILSIFPGGISAEGGLSADSLPARYRTGVIDPQCLNVPFSAAWLLEFDSSAGIRETAFFLAEGTDDPFLIVKRFHDWIVSTIDFDDQAFLEARNTGEDPHDVVKRKRGTSLGFSRLFSLMCGYADITSMVITGKTNRYYLDGGKIVAAHFWNAVYINNKWYIVDTAEDAKAIEYSDRELFIAPEAKIIKHLPEDDRYQFLENPVENEEFTSRPLFEQSLVKFGIKPLGGFELKTTEYEKTGGETVLTKRRDVFTLAGEILTLRFTKPDNVYFQTVLRDAAGKIYNRHAFTYVEGIDGRSVTKAAVVQFSLPENTGPDKGPYEASVFAADSRDRRKELLYRFTLRGAAPPERENSGLNGFGQMQKRQRSIGLPRFPLLPKKDAVFPKHWLYYYSCGFLSEGDGVTSVVISRPDDVELRGILRTSEGEEINTGITSSYVGVNQLQYTFTAPEAGRYFITIEGKKRNSRGGYDTLAEASFFEQHPLSPPEEVFQFEEHYFTSGITLLSDNFHRLYDEGCYRAVFKAPPDFRMECGLQTAEGGGVPGGAVYERYDDMYYFYFLPTSEDQTGIIYSIDEQNKKRVVCSLLFGTVFPIAGKGPYIYEPGWAYRKNGLEDLTMQLNYENLHRSGRPGNAMIELRKPAEVKLAASYAALDGTDMRKGSVVVSTPDAETVRYYFALPAEEPVLVTVLAAEAGDRVPREYDIPVVDFMLYPDEKRAEPVPPPGEIIFYEQFYRRGFRYVSDTLEKRAGTTGPATLTIETPPAAELSCRLYSDGGEEIQNAVSFKVRDNDYTFTFDPPAGIRNVQGRVFYRNLESQWRTMCWFTLPD